MRKTTFNFPVTTLLGSSMENLGQIYYKFGLGEFKNVSYLFQNYLDTNPCPDHQVNLRTVETEKLVNHFAADILIKLGCNQNSMQSDNISRK